MKALVKAKAEPGIWLQQIDKPEIGDLDVLVKVHKTAICGTDMHIYHWDDWSQKTINVPMTIGHEFSGSIVAVGSSVVGLDVGMRVSAEGHITCGMCRKCRGGLQHLCPKTIGVGVNRAGAFAEYISIPASNVILLPENISDEQGAILDPLGNATHTALSYDLVGEDVLITGAGPIGLMAALIAKKVGARHVVITDINPHRLQMATELGVSAAVDVSKTSLSEVQHQLGMTEGFDVGLEMSGVGSAFSDMLDTVVHGGKIALLGILPNGTPINWEQVIFKGIDIRGIYGREMYETWHKMIAMLQSGLDVSPIITHHFPIEDYQTAFEVMASGQSGKVILDWQS
jgi:threonine 3-dehydrogenase